jgi:hypothetical protein
MSNPVRSDVHVNRPLGSIAVATIQAQTDFVHALVAPVVPVLKQSDRYFVYTRDYWFRALAEVRAPATESAGSGFHIDNTPTYFCQKYSYHMDIDDDTQVNADDPINLQRDATEFLTQGMWRRREQIFMNRYMSTGVWGGLLTTNSSGVKVAEDYTPTIQWDMANSNPMADVAKLKTNIKRTTSLEPNVMVVTHDVNEALKQNALVIDRIKYTQKGIATEELLAELFGVDKYIVASAVINSSQEGQLANYDFLINNKILLTYVAPSPGILKPSSMYNFSWTGMYGASAFGTRIKTMRMEHLAADRVEIDCAFDMHVVAPDLGILGTNLISDT